MMQKILANFPFHALFNLEISAYVAEPQHCQTNQVIFTWGKSFPCIPAGLQSSLRLFLLEISTLWGRDLAFHSVRYHHSSQNKM